MVTEIDQRAVIATDGIYRAAFPAFRVFVFGHEVSGDVTEVRVNHAGGSLDRSPGTCSFTLVNPLDKYMLDHDDMIALSNSRGTLVSTLEKNVQDYKGTETYLRGTAGEDPTVLKEFLRLISAQPEKYAELTAQVEAAYGAVQTAQLHYQEYWEEGKVPDAIKFEVLKQKAFTLSSIENEDVAWFLEKFGEDFEEAYSAEFVYQFQEGDSIFHPNDPIRVAFRDPFNPRIWYWMFTGFLDSATEDVGTDQESLLTITATDVSKMPRYSLIQLDTGLLDQSIRDLFANVPGVAGTLAETKFVPMQQLFAGFTIFEILEILFFGVNSFLGVLNETTDRFIAGLSPEDIRTLLMGAYRMSPSDADKLSPKDQLAMYREFRGEMKATRFSGANIPPVATPQGVTFKRRNDRYGTYAYFVGDELDPFDEAVGGSDSHISHGNLRKLNDIIHHRVRIEDLQNMAAEGDDDLLAGAFKLYSPEEVITEIGTHPDAYPVGGGRVIYVTPATLGSKLPRGVLDQTVVNSVAMHSEFKDRLTFLYDLAERIEFCCYATPKGDMVFEMPFYDFDPWLFDDEDSHISNAEIQNEVLINQEWLSEWEASSNYTEEELREMLGLRAQIELDREGFSPTQEDAEKFNYIDHFTINKHETTGYSNSMNDQGMITAYRAKPNFFENYEAGEDDNAKVYEYVLAPGLAPILGFRIAEGSPWGFCAGQSSAQLYAALELRRTNAEARNIGLQVLPSFGLMVNRPLYWRQRNYIANIVSCQHSIVWLSSCDSMVNLNHAKGWTGSLDGDRMEKFTYFGGDMPFNLSRLVFRRTGGNN